MPLPAQTGPLPRYDPIMRHESTLGDILANSITHGLGVLLAVVGTVFLLLAAARGGTRLLVSCAIFAASLILLYLCSTLYHALTRTRVRHLFHVLDHASIYVLIAGTYTPFTLISLRGPTGWTLFAVVWAIALAGILFKCFAVGRFPSLSTALYLLQGWFVVVALHQLIPAIGWTGLAWLGAGGLAYTLGVVFYVLDRRRYFHATWHVFVLAGSLAHYFAIFYFVVDRHA